MLCNRWRMVSRLARVLKAIIAAIAAISSTRVRMPRCGALASEMLVCGVIRSWDKFVSCAVDGEEMLRIGWIALQLLSQLENLIVDRARRRITVVSPDLVQKFIAAQDSLRILSEKLQELELVRS